MIYMVACYQNSKNKSAQANTYHDIWIIIVNMGRYKTQRSDHNFYQSQTD